MPRKTERKPAAEPISFAPLSLDDVLRGVMETGGPPEMPKRQSRDGEGAIDQRSTRAAKRARPKPGK